MFGKDFDLVRTGGRIPWAKEISKFGKKNNAQVILHVRANGKASDFIL